MNLGMEVRLGPGHSVLDGDPAPPPHNRAQQPPTFQCKTAGWVKMPLGKR